MLGLFLVAFLFGPPAAFAESTSPHLPEVHAEKGKAVKAVAGPAAPNREERQQIQIYGLRDRVKQLEIALSLEQQKSSALTGEAAICQNNASDPNRQRQIAEMRIKYKLGDADRFNDQGDIQRQSPPAEVTTASRQPRRAPQSTSRLRPAPRPPLLR